MSPITREEIRAIKEQIVEEMLTAARLRCTQIQVGEGFLHLPKDEAILQAECHEQRAHERARTLLAALSLVSDAEPSP